LVCCTKKYLATLTEIAIPCLFTENISHTLYLKA
jgi:hypothetical protein